MLPARVRDYSPAMLDELTSAGEVLWAGAGGLPGGDGWISLVPADLAPLLLPEPLEVPDGGRARSSSSSPAGRRCSSAGLSDLVGATDDTAMADLVWDLVWAGVLTNDTLAPLRTRLGGGGTHRSKPAAPRARTGGTRYGRARLGRPAMPTPHRAARRSPAAGPGCPSGSRTPPGGPPPAPRRCSSGTAC